MPKKTLQKEAQDSYLKEKFASRLRKAKAYRNITNKEIVRRSIELGLPMSESTVSKSLKGLIRPTIQRVALWSEILDVYPYWLWGYGSEDHVIGASYEWEAKQYLDEINQIFFKLHPDLQFLLLQIARELMTSNKNIAK